MLHKNNYLAEIADRVGVPGFQHVRLGKNLHITEYTDLQSRCHFQGFIPQFCFL